MKKISITILALLLLTTGCNGTPTVSPSISLASEKITSQPVSSISEEASEVTESSSVIQSSEQISSEAASSSEVTSKSSSAQSSSEITSISVSSAAESSSEVISAQPKDFYLAGSWNGYLVDDELYKMTQVTGSDTWYIVVVELTADNRDEMYDGHWYKITEGNWDHSYGIDNYVEQPAPVKYLPGGNAIGLGSIWVDENIELTVMLDSEEIIIYDNANGKELPTP